MISFRSFRFFPISFQELNQPVLQARREERQAINSVNRTNSILANFRLDPADGASALEAGNPIQAFLDCILRQVEREREEGASGTEEEKGGESKMEE